jgi:glycyl-tRNA synthetase beta chain
MSSEHGNPSPPPPLPLKGRGESSAATEGRANVLVELQVEELPPKALKKLGEAFGAEIAAALRAARLLDEGSAVTTFATPRRLAVHITRVAAATPPESKREKLVPVAVGLKPDGGKTPALQKKLEALGAGTTEVAALERSSDGKQEMLYLAFTAPARPLAGELQLALDRALDRLPIPKVMSYQLADGWSKVHFVRPAHSLVALYGAEVVPVSALGLQAGRATVGHRFEAKASPIEIRDADSYAQQLADEGAVIASFAERRKEIARLLAVEADKAELTPIADDALLDEVTGLVERPNVLTCQFEPEFLEVPQECLILTMKANQKYFPLLDATGRLTNKFLIVSNIRPADPSAVITGNERVVRPRLADAKFFYDQDRKATLESRVDGLHSVVYHAKLGSQLDRVVRVTSIAAQIAQAVNANPAHVKLAARLAKADLRTLMVGEFPELQGIMGSYYARHDGEVSDVVDAIRDQYTHRFESDATPVNLVSVCVYLADRAEMLVGLFGIGERPTGDKDPFGLRRAALGIISVFELLGAQHRLEGRAPSLDLPEILAFAETSFGGKTLGQGTVAQVASFVYERCFNQLVTTFDQSIVSSVISLRPPLHEVVKRIHAVKQFKSLPEAESLAAANKRISNILKKSDGVAASALIDPALLFEPAEQSLAAALDAARPTAEQFLAHGDYTGMLKSLAPLKLPVDKFFDDVMVNVDDQRLRANRLALLAALRAEMNRVADLSLLAAG